MNNSRRMPRVENRLLRELLPVALIAAFGVGVAATASAQARPAPVVSRDVSLVPVVGEAKKDLLRAFRRKSRAQSYSPAHHECPGGTAHIQGIACSSTNTQQLATSDCFVGGFYGDFYSFSGTAGQHVTISMTSSVIDTYLVLFDPEADVVAEDDNSGGGTNAVITFTIDATATWFIVASSSDPGELGAYTLTLTCGSAPPPAIIPVVGSTPGAVGEAFFRTSVQLYNPRTERMTGRLVYHPAGSSSTPTDPALTYVLEPGETRSIADLLPAMGLTGLGSLDVVPDTDTATPVLVVRVFNDAGAAGTTGFTEEAVTPAEALVAGEEGFLIAPPDPALYRFNVGVRTLGSGATLTITARNAAGTVTRTLTRVYPPNFFEQRDSASFLNGAAVAANESITIRVDSGSAIVYGATVDNRTNDPSLQLAKQAP